MALNSNKGTVQVKTGKNLVKAANGAWMGDVREHPIDLIEGMILSEYMKMDKRILNAQQKRFWDTAVIQANVPLLPQHLKRLFVKGYTDDDTVWNIPTQMIQTKGEVMTNMIKNGEFSQGTLTIVKRIEVRFNINSSQAASYEKVGFPSDLAASPVPNYDPALVYDALSRQVLLTLKRGANKQIIVEGLLEEFPISCAASGAGSGAFFIQNGPGVVNEEKLMFPEIYEGGEDFEIELKPLNDKLIFPIPVEVTVLLNTTQVFTVYR